MQYFYLILTFLFIGILIKITSWYLNKETEKKKELTVDDIKTFHIFPDYPKDHPYECRPGEELFFIVKGYTDKYQVEEVPINADKVIWKHTEGNGRFKGDRNLKTGKYSGESIDFVAPKIDIYKKEKLIFVSAHYRVFMDATWIKVVN